MLRDIINEIECIEEKIKKNGIKESTMLFILTHNILLID